MNDYLIKQTRYGTEYKVFVSRNGIELLRIEGLREDEADVLVDILSKGRLAFLE